MRTFTANSEERHRVKTRIARHLQSEDLVVLAFLHGSFREGRFRDIDIALFVDSDDPERDRYEARLERSLSDLTGYPVDVRFLNEAPLLFRYSVLTHGEVLVSKNEDLREVFQRRTLALYHDFSHHVRTYQREALGFST